MEPDRISLIMENGSNLTLPITPRAQPDAPRMLREEVTAEDVSEIVSRWTGIPVQARYTKRPISTVSLQSRTPQTTTLTADPSAHLRL